jgi:hypothetical protein
MTDTPQPVTKVPELDLHELCKIIPPHTDKEFTELTEDIANNKLQVPIVTYEGKILDGRGRYNACAWLAKQGVETNFRTEPYTGPDPRRYVVSANVKRRHLNESQRALIAAQLATFGHGGDRTGKASFDPLTQQEAAMLLNVSEPSVERAKKVLKNGVPALVEAVKTGQLRVSAVENFAKSDKQDELIKECDGDVVKAVKKLPKQKPVAKPETPEQERKRRKKQVEDLKYWWQEEWNVWQRQYFVKTFKDDIIAILKEIDNWKGVVDGGGVEAAPAPKDELDIPQALQRATVSTAGIAGVGKVQTQYQVKPA